jgi:hypothetical protein
MERLSEYQKSLLDKKYTNTLSEEEAKEVHNLLNSEEFGTEAQQYLQTTYLVEEAVRAELKEDMIAWEKSADTPPKPRMKWLSIAAVITILGVFTYALFQNKQNQDLSSFYEVYPSTKTLRSVDESSLAVAFKLYEQKEFVIAAKEFAKDTSSLAKFYEAQSYFGANSYEKAQVIFAELTLSSSPYASTSAWYNALCLLQLDKDLAKSEIQRIANSKSSYATDAKRLLRSMR